MAEVEPIDFSKCSTQELLHVLTCILEEADKRGIDIYMGPDEPEEEGMGTEGRWT